MAENHQLISRTFRKIAHGSNRVSMVTRLSTASRRSRSGSQKPWEQVCSCAIKHPIWTLRSELSQFGASHCYDCLVAEKGSRELLGRISPHRCGPIRPAASTVLVHSGIMTSSGAEAMKSARRPATTRPLWKLVKLIVYRDQAARQKGSRSQDLARPLQPQACVYSSGSPDQHQMPFFNRVMVYRLDSLQCTKSKARHRVWWWSMYRMRFRSSNSMNKSARKA